MKEVSIEQWRDEEGYVNYQDQNHDHDLDFKQMESSQQFGNVCICSPPSYFGQASVGKGDQGGDEEGYANCQEETRVDQELGKDKWEVFQRQWEFF